MELVIERDALLKLTTLAQGVVPKKSTKPILNHMLMSADPEKGLTVTATDEQLSSQGAEDADVQEPGQACVSAQDLHSIVRNLPPGPVKLLHHSGQEQLEINSARINFKLHTLPADEFPEFQALNPDTIFRYPVKDLLTLVENTSYAVSQDESRYYLGGVYVECRSEEPLRAVSTDGHRLALSEAEPPEGFQLQPGQILPRKLLNELPKMLDDRKGTVEFGFEGSRVMFTNGRQTLNSLLIDGTFPDYRPVIPRKPKLSCRVGRVELLNALRRVSLLSPDKMGGVRIEVDDRLLKISSQHSGRGTGHQVVDILEGGGALEIGFNAVFFVDALNVINHADVWLEFTDKQNPCLLRPHIEPETEEGAEEPEDNGHLFLNVIMPMRL
jgi:DNA polymerase-3 subunit beta